MKPRCPHGGDPLERLRRHHREHHQGRRPRRSLQLRLFVWLGITILLTVVVVSAVGWVTSSGPTAWQRTMHGATVMGARRFAGVWSDDRARGALAAEIAAELDVGVAVRDVDGRVLDAYGPVTTRTYLVIPVEAEGRRVGSVAVYAKRFKRPLEVLPPLLVAFVVLWALSGVPARHLARPLADLAQTADAIGRGELDRRTRVARHAPREVALVAEAIDDMASRIQRQMADQRELLAAVSHEVRSPLARIRLLVEMARPATSTDDGDGHDGDGATVSPDERPSDGEREHALAEIEREVEEIDALVGSLLASSRLDFGTLDPREVDPIALARDALVRAGLPARLLDAPTDPPRLRADPTLLARAIANLLDNARVHGGGPARVGLVADGDVVRFEVDDDGPGLGDDTERVFLPFHRKPGSHGALGLGLSIVARIAEAHGGGSWAENRDGGGARIGFWIPAATATPPAENVARSPGVG